MADTEGQDFEYDDDEDARFRLARASIGTSVWSVAVYLLDRAYGGPEEGGWYFDCAQPQLEKWLPVPLFFYSKDEAIEAAGKMQEALDAPGGVNEGRRPIDSVLSEGVYRARVERGWPQGWPAQTPHYE
jgi:hypothetical protein